MRCCIKACPASGKLKEEENSFTPLRGHNHDLNLYSADERALEVQLRQAASSTETSQPIRAIFDSVTRHDPLGASVSFRHVESGMLKSRQRLLAPLPAGDMEELIQSLEEVDSIYGLYFKGPVRIEDQPYGLIFVSEEAEARLNSGVLEDMNFDGTFETCPPPFYQVFTLLAEYLGAILPMVSVLMTGKSEQQYDAVFGRIRELFPLFLPTRAMGDYELASRNSLKSHFPNIDLSGCVFHEAQNVYRRLQKRGYTYLYSTNAQFRRWCRDLMALPFLPADRIGPTLNVLRQQSAGFAATVQPAILYLADYWRRTYFDTYGPQELSVYRLPRAFVTKISCRISLLQYCLKSLFPLLFLIKIFCHFLLNAYLTSFQC